MNKVKKNSIKKLNFFTLFIFIFLISLFINLSSCISPYCKINKQLHWNDSYINNLETDVSLNKDLSFKKKLRRFSILYDIIAEIRKFIKILDCNLMCDDRYVCFDSVREHIFNLVAYLSKKKNLRCWKFVRRFSLLLYGDERWASGCGKKMNCKVHSDKN